LCHYYLATLDFLLGDLRRADERLSDALVLAEHASDPGLDGMLLANRAAIAALSGDLQAGQSQCERALSILEKDGDRWAEHWVYYWAAGISLLADDHAEVRRLVAYSLRLILESGAYETLQTTLCYAAVLGATHGRHQAAARLWGAAESIANKTGLAPGLPSAFSAVEAPARRKTERALDDAVLQQQEAEGRAMSIDQAIALALEQVSES
jgi:hypothetical protein